MELDRYIINVDAITGTCIVGELKECSSGVVYSNKTQFPLERDTIQFAIKAIGKKATISIDQSNTIEYITPCEQNEFKNKETSLVFIGFVLRKLDMIRNIIEFSLEDTKEFYVRALASPRVLHEAFLLLGQKVNFELSNKDIRLNERNKRILLVSSYQDWGTNSMVSESVES